jgi:two-component system, chemotaxis family, protein-glutamate methylesterase/glutaminase
MTRALVVDDTILYRGIMSDVLSRLPDVKVVGTAPNGRIAISKIYALQPDIVTLDIEMPVMNGIEVLEALSRKGLESSVVVVSSLTRRGGELTMRALELGAFDFVTKPEGGERSLDEFSRVLGAIVESMRRRQEIRGILKGLPLSGGRRTALPSGSATTAPDVPMAAPPSAFPARRGGSEVVAIGVSTGGPQALLSMLPAIPADFGAPILIVQHMPPLFTANLAQSLTRCCAIRVKEAENGEELVAGTAYIAPGGRQARVALGSDAETKIIRVTDDPPENNCRPSVDYLFRSVAHLFYGRATGVVMTGMGSDGLAGSRAMKKAGAILLAQDEESCTVYGMPKALVDSGLADAVLPLGRLPAAIADTVGFRA